MGFAWWKVDVESLEMEKGKASSELLHNDCHRDEWKWKPNQGVMTHVKWNHNKDEETWTNISSKEKSHEWSEINMHNQRKSPWPNPK